MKYKVEYVETDFSIAFFGEPAKKEIIVESLKEVHKFLKETNLETKFIKVRKVRKEDRDDREEEIDSLFTPTQNTA